MKTEKIKLRKKRTLKRSQLAEMNAHSLELSGKKESKND
jgi:hypothetical protein